MTGTEPAKPSPPAIHLSSPEGREVPGELLRRGLHRLFRHLGIHGGEMSVTFLEDEAIRELNRRYLDHDWVPDVLSFALHDPGEAPVGDVYVGLDQAGRQAEEHGIPCEEELLRLTLHGTLHALGYDHPDEPGEREDSELYRIQEAMVREMGGGR